MIITVTLKKKRQVTSFQSCLKSPSGLSWTLYNTNSSPSLWAASTEEFGFPLPFQTQGVTMSYLLTNLQPLFFSVPEHSKLILLPRGPLRLQSLSYNGLPPEFCILPLRPCLKVTPSQRPCLTNLKEEASPPMFLDHSIPFYFLYCNYHSSSRNSIIIWIHKIN